MAAVALDGKVKQDSYMGFSETKLRAHVHLRFRHTHQWTKECDRTGNYIVYLVYKC